MLYEMFWIEYGCRPDELREMAFYDAYMILYARAVKHCNREANKDKKGGTGGSALAASPSTSAINSRLNPGK